MGTPSRGHTRAERMKEHAALIEHARQVLGAMGLIVRGREARARSGATPLEIEFARTDVDGPALPAAVWVALRRDDVNAAIQAMAEVSDTHFIVDEREVMGAGYRLQSVQDTLPLPETDVLVAQLGAMLDVPIDVLKVLSQWGADDPRAVSEIDELLTSRFGPAERAHTETDAPVPEASQASTAPTGQLTMTVADAAQVLRLDEDQARALATLVRNATVTITAS